MTVDFRNTPEHLLHKSGKLRDKIPTDQRPITADGKLLTPKQVRARARRAFKRGDMDSLTSQEIAILQRKPIDEWDLDELAHGRPKDVNGRFSGPKPKWITREIHEQSMDRFKAAIKTGMNVSTVDALTAIQGILNNEETDEKGKPLVPPSTKLDAAKFLLEHVVGKPKQQLEADVSVQLQSILAVVMGNPTETFMNTASGGLGYTVGHLPGVTIPMGADEKDIVDAEVEEDDELLAAEEALYG